MAEACRALGIPVVGGNVSLYNESRGPRHRPHAGGRACSASSTGSTGRPPGVRLGRRRHAARARRRTPGRSPGRGGRGSAGHRGGPPPDARPRRAPPRSPTSSGRWSPTGSLAGVHDTADGLGVALAEMAVQSGHGLRRRRPGRRPRVAVRRVASRVVACVSGGPRRRGRRGPRSRGGVAGRPRSARPAATASSSTGLLDVALARPPPRGATGSPPPSAPARPTRPAPSRCGFSAVRLADWSRARRRGARRPRPSTTAPRRRAASSACTHPGSRSPTSPTSACSRCSTAGRSRPGMAVSDGAEIFVVKDQGLVASVFDDRDLAALTGHLAIGHCRYSTTGSSTWRNAQPAYRAGRPPLRPRPQRQPHQHRGAGGRGRDAARHGHQRHRPHRRADRQRAGPPARGRASTSATSSGRSPRCCRASKAPSRS